MRRKVLRPLTILALVSVAFCATAWTVSYVQGLPQQDSQNTENTKRKTFRELAEEGDIEGEVREGNFNREYSDLLALAKDSDAVVLGSILDEEAYFSGDSEITTKYKIDVQRIMKDGTPEAARLSEGLGRKSPDPLTTPLYCSRFGGTVHVKGHRASLKAKGDELLTPGKTYVLFLHWTGWNYHIAGGMSGAVLMEDNSRTKPLGTNEVLKKYGGLSLEAFIQEVLG